MATLGKCRQFLESATSKIQLENLLNTNTLELRFYPFKVIDIIKGREHLSSIMFLVQNNTAYLHLIYFLQTLELQNAFLSLEGLINNRLFHVKS